MDARIVKQSPSNIAPRYTEMTLCGRTYKLCATLNVINEFAKRYGDAAKVYQKSKNIAELLWITKTILDEAIDVHNDENEEQWDYLSEKQIGRKIDVVGTLTLNEILEEVMVASTPDAEEGDNEIDDDDDETEEIAESDESKNATAG